MGPHFRTSLTSLNNSTNDRLFEDFLPSPVEDVRLIYQLIIRNGMDFEE